MIRVTGISGQKGLVDVMRDPTTLLKDVRQINDSLSGRDGKQYPDRIGSSLLIMHHAIV